MNGMPAPGRKHLHSKIPWGWGWTRGLNLSDDPKYGAPLPAWDEEYPAPLNPARVNKRVDALRADPDPNAWYGRSEGDDEPYNHKQFAQRYHRPHSGGKPDINWPPNEGAVPDTRLFYCDAERFVEEFGDRIDRIGFTGGRFFGLMEDGESASYEARAIHYVSLTSTLRTYRLIPEKFRKRWRICVMDTARALGQPGGSLGLVFFDGKGKQLSARQLTRTEALRYVD